jgi:hypothetical protein
LSRRNQDQAVQTALFIGVLSRHQMAKMHGIKTAAKKSDFHAAGT